MVTTSLPDDVVTQMIISFLQSLPFGTFATSAAVAHGIRHPESLVAGLLASMEGICKLESVFIRTYTSGPPAYSSGMYAYRVKP